MIVNMYTRENKEKVVKYLLKFFNKDYVTLSQVCEDKNIDDLIFNVRDNTEYGQGMVEMFTLIQKERERVRKRGLVPQAIRLTKAILQKILFKD